MIAKEKFTKIIYMLLAICIIVLFLLIFDTSCTALKTNDIDYVDYINKELLGNNVIPSLGGTTGILGGGVFSVVFFN